ncbi:MAG: hypothetical protein ACK5AO_10740 [bacterium]
MKTRFLLLLAIASIMTISTADAHINAGQKITSLNTCDHNRRGKMARVRAHRMRHHHMIGRPFMRKARTPRVGLSLVF